MNISVIGVGYVGLVSGVCFAKLGHNVICVDIDKEKVEKINEGISPIYEKGLKDLLKRYKKNIKATISYKEAIKNSAVTFICVGTPFKEDGDINLKYIDMASKEIAKQLKDKEGFHSVVVRSTVVPGTTKNHIIPILEKYSGKKAGVDFGVSMNPEFLREGVAIDDFLNPDRIVNGYIDRKTKDLLYNLYEDFKVKIYETTPATAEMIKYASNCFLATKISFINEIGNFCKKLGIDAYDVAEGMGFDKRIGRAFLNSGIGWGGSCFGKDLMALQAWAKKNNQNSMIIDSTINVNEKQPLKLIELLKKHIPDIKGKTIGVLGLSFKPDTDDVRDSRAIPIVKKLIEEKANIVAYDPEAIDNFKKIFPDIKYCNKTEEILDSDAVLITTIWDEFKKLNYENSIVIDGRNLDEAKDARVYEGICW